MLSNSTTPIHYERYFGQAGCYHRESVSRSCGEKNNLPSRSGRTLGPNSASAHSMASILNKIRLRVHKITGGTTFASLGYFVLSMPCLEAVSTIRGLMALRG